jgi:hypothetical protein
MKAPTASTISCRHRCCAHGCIQTTGTTNTLFPPPPRSQRYSPFLGHPALPTSVEVTRQRQGVGLQGGRKQAPLKLSWEDCKSSCGTGTRVATSGQGLLQLHLFLCKERSKALASTARAGDSVSWCVSCGATRVIVPLFSFAAKAVAVTSFFLWSFAALPLAAQPTALGFRALGLGLRA